MLMLYVLTISKTSISDMFDMRPLAIGQILLAYNTLPFSFCKISLESILKVPGVFKQRFEMASEDFVEIWGNI